MQLLALRDDSQVADTRRRAVALADRIGFDDTEAGRVAIVATELSTNVLKHGGGGSILLSAVEEGGAPAVELVAIDRGRGMSDLARCLEDGYSTAGSAGEGLGAVRRQSHAFDVASWPGLGTAVLARVGRGRPPRLPAPPPRSGAVRIAMPGEEVCGDAFAFAEADGRIDVVVADGLGHGPGAAAAALEAVRVFERHRDAPPERLVAAAHGALRSTRGAAVAVARIEPAAGRVAYSGLGNIVGVVVGPADSRRMVSMNGTAGLAMHRIQVFDYALPPGGVVVMHSDGVSASWSLDRYPGLLGRHPVLIAAVLYRDHARGRDDATVAVVKGGAS